MPKERQKVRFLRKRQASSSPENNLMGVIKMKRRDNILLTPPKVYLRRKNRGKGTIPSYILTNPWDNITQMLKFYRKKKPSKVKTRFFKKNHKTFRVFSDNWENAVVMAYKYHTFDAPDQIQLSLLKKGDIVQIGNDNERFWVKIKDFYDDQIVGEVRNILISTKEYNFNDYVIFSWYHIHNIYYYIN